MRIRRIKTRPDKNNDAGLIIEGWFQGKQTYLWLGKVNEELGEKRFEFLGTLSGQKLYRLAKAIVKQFEGK